MLLCWDPFVGL